MQLTIQFMLRTGLRIPSPLTPRYYQTGAGFIPRLASHWQHRQANLWVVSTLWSLTVKKMQLLNSGRNQISAKRGPASRFVIEANHKPLQPKSNSRQSKKMMVRGWSIQPQSKYRSKYWIAFGQISKYTVGITHSTAMADFWLSYLITSFSFSCW